MAALHFLVPGDINTRTGGYLYDKRIIRALEQRGWEVCLHSLPGDFPRPSRVSLQEARALLTLLPDGAIVVVDGLALGGMPELARQHGGRLKLVALIHHPLALETGLSPRERETLFQSEQAALRAATRVIVTSPATVRNLADYGVEPTRIAVVVPGTDPAPLAAGSGNPLQLLCVAALIPRKGHGDLLKALARLKQLDWRLDCVGSRQRDPATAAVLEALVAERGLARRVAFPGEADREALEAYYHRADIFVLPSHHEGYGMALAEALARGLPVVSTSAGAIPDTVPADAGLLVPAGDIGALAQALERVLGDAALRAKLVTGARRAREVLPDWNSAGRRFGGELERL
ncbi:MAG: glycosyltransferase family 4 protein [Candidatus Competibacteraceae bacterium]|nr:glycosyltransferase family 4 protein [Candidatus Competibacteraceae bacterium]